MKHAHDSFCVCVCVSQNHPNLTVCAALAYCHSLVSLRRHVCLEVYHAKSGGTAVRVTLRLEFTAEESDTKVC